MELIFNKVGKYYESVFELTADANLHIEFNNASPVKLYQRTTGGGWDLVDDVNNAVGKVTDIDLTALIYPKYIKVVCRTEPTYAEVVSNGEITELKYQEKSIEVTANGNTEVIPDAGFAGLTKVNVSVNVPQSGGSGGGENLNIRYLKMAGVSDLTFCQWAIQVKSHQPEYNSSGLSYPEVVRIEGGYFYGSFRNSRNLTLLAISIDVDLPCPSTVDGSNTFREHAYKMGMDDAALEAEIAAIEITKEEFYDLTNYHGVM